MRTTLTLLLGACASMASAQLANGSFEDGLNGWMSISYYGLVEQPAIVALPAPGQGSFAVSVPSTYTVDPLELAVQQLPMYNEGDAVHFGGWLKRQQQGAQDPATFGLCFCDSSAAHDLFGTALGWSASIWSWTYCEAVEVIPADPQINASVCMYLNGGTNQGWMPADALYDGLFVELDASTGATDKPGPGHLHFRPNPASDKLWVDLPDVPRSIIAIDASGRTHDLKNFTHRDRTLEVDVNSLPPGITLLRITTYSGTQNLRFLKM